MSQFKAIESVKNAHKARKKEEVNEEKDGPWSDSVGGKNRPTCGIYIPKSHPELSQLELSQLDVLLT